MCESQSRLNDTLKTKGSVAPAIDQGCVPPVSPGERSFSVYDPDRFGHLGESEILRRIGALLATALIRSGRLPRRARRTVEADAGAKPADIDPVELIHDPVTRRVAHFLKLSGAASPAELANALGITRRTLARKLRLLRKSGLCRVTGKTRATRYGLQTDFASN
jgi:hypothetical protein